MSQPNRDAISKALGVEPVLIDAQHLSAQRRRRLFWCNWEVSPPQTPGIAPSPAAEGQGASSPLLKDVLEPVGRVSELRHSERMLAGIFDRSVSIKGHPPGTCRFEAFPYYSDTDRDKSQCMGSYMYASCHNILIDRRFRPPMIRKFSPVEIERLQGFPDNYTDSLPVTHRLKALGNAVCVPVVLYLLGALRRPVTPARGSSARGSSARGSSARGSSARGSSVSSAREHRSRRTVISTRGRRPTTPTRRV
jgi:site-specific DNA-cytosine methylase